MPAKAAKRPVPREDIQAVAQQLQCQQPTDAAAVSSIAKQTFQALGELLKGGYVKERVAACLPAILQCFSWLVEAWLPEATTRDPSTTGDGSLLEIANAWCMCLQLVAQAFATNSKMDVGVVRAILKPNPTSSSSSSSRPTSSESSTAAISPVPEVLHHLAAVAGVCLQHGCGDDAQYMYLPGLAVLSTWRGLVAAAMTQSSSSGSGSGSGSSSAMLPWALASEPILQQLLWAMTTSTRLAVPDARELLQLQWLIARLLNREAVPTAHPDLRRYGLRPGKSHKAASANAVVETLQRRHVWMGALAARCAALEAAAAAARAVPRFPLEPAALCPPYYLPLTPRWGEEGLQPYLTEVAHTLGVLQALLMAEMWQLWPWQLEVMDTAAAAAAAALAAADAADDADDDGADDAASGEGAEAEAGAEPCTGGSDGSSSGGEEDHVGFCDTFMDRPMVGLPLTPQLVAASSSPALKGPQLGPVTRQELQVVLNVMAQAAGPLCRPAAQLFVLLLARADPELRAAFLNGPDASLLLATLMMWGFHPVDSGGCRVSPVPWHASSEETGDWLSAKNLLLGALKGTHAKSGRELVPCVWAAAVLGMCFLEPVPGREVDLKRPSRAACSVLVPAELPAGMGHEHLVVLRPPIQDMQLVAGVTPLPLLVAAMEALVRGGTSGSDYAPNSLLMCGTVGTMVHALHRHLTTDSSSRTSCGGGKAKAKAKASSSSSTGPSSSSTAGVVRTDATSSSSTDNGSSSVEGGVHAGAASSSSTDNGSSSIDNGSSSVEGCVHAGAASSSSTDNGSSSIDNGSSCMEGGVHAGAASSSSGSSSSGSAAASSGSSSQEGRCSDASSTAPTSSSTSGSTPAGSDGRRPCPGATTGSAKQPQAGDKQLQAVDKQAQAVTGISSEEARSGVISACASLAIAAVHHLEALAAPGAGRRQPQFFLRDVSSVLSCWCGVAVDLLRLAAHEVASGRAGRATMTLAIAAQRLAAVCAEKQQDVLLGLAQHAGPASAQTVAAAPVFSLANHAALLVQLATPGITYEAVQMSVAVRSLQQAVFDMQQRAARVPPSPHGSQRDTAAEEEAQQQLQQESLPPEIAAGGEHLQRSWGYAGEVRKACRPRLLMVGCDNLHDVGICPTRLFSSHERVTNCKRNLCGGCKVVRYCCRLCQSRDWPRHRRVCGRLAAAAAAAEAAAAAGGAAAATPRTAAAATAGTAAAAEGVAAAAEAEALAAIASLCGPTTAALAAAANIR